MTTSLAMRTVISGAVRFSTKRLSRLLKAKQRYVDEGRLAALIAMVARRGRVGQRERFGMMDLEAARLRRAGALDLRLPPRQ